MEYPECVKKLSLLASVLFLAFSIAAVPALNSRGDVIITEYEDGSAYFLLDKALRKSVSFEWFDEYTTKDSILISSSLERLQEILPLENFCFSEEKESAIRVLNLSDGTYISFTFKDGLIHAISFS